MCCKKQLLSFCALLRLKILEIFAFFLFFFSTSFSTLPFPQLWGREWEFPRGSWLLLAPGAVSRQPCCVLFGLSLGQHGMFHGMLEQAPGGEGVIGSSHWGRGSEPQPGFRLVFPTNPNTDLLGQG